MGKSAGKWIKTVLFGKKSSKSKLSKNIVPDKKTSENAPVEDSVTDPPVRPDPCLLTERGTDTLELPKGTSGSPCHTTALCFVNQVTDTQSDDVSLGVSDAGRQEQAATIAQAAFRGYLARRAFRALKGIIRLQALIRGHLVRRQAVATFHCMLAIVRIQALARKVDTGATLLSGSKKLAANTFIHKLLVTLPTAMPLSLQYDLTEPNSAWNWLERWSKSHFWETPGHSKKVMKARPQKNQGGAKVVEPEVGKSRRTIQKVPTGANGLLAFSEMDKPKHNPRKAAMSNPTDLEERPHTELERVKRNLSKISASAAATFEKSEGKMEKAQPLLSVKMETNSACDDVTEEEKAISSENIIDSVVDKLDVQGTPLQRTMDALVDVTCENHPISESHSLENGLQIQHLATLDDELSCKEEPSDKDHHKTRKRRSLPAKQETPVNVSQNSRGVPSYMAATESAKAKLRAQGSPILDEDGTDYGITRRHSLPISTNSRLTSSSPRIQKQVQANGRGGSKSNKPLMISRDDKVVLPGWRR